MSSKKDYEALAEVLVSQRRYIPPPAYRRLVERIGHVYVKDNPHFKLNLWHKACGL